MRAEIFCCVFLCVLGASFAQMNVGTAWQGTWSDGKRGGGGSLYICVDSENNVAHGAYSGIGTFSGFLKGNTLTGSWYEAGYDRPYGPFQLTINGNSFSGSWSYWEGLGLAPSASFTWSGSKSSSDVPDDSQCLRPNGGNTFDGKFVGADLCYVPANTYLNTEQPSAFATFSTFGQVAGYSPDDGHHVLFSDYYYPDDDETVDGRFRPEGNSTTTFGPCSGCFDDDGDTDHGDEIPTRRIVVGALINDATFCGYFWKGLYNEAYNDGKPICFSRSTFGKSDPFACGSDIIYINGQADRFGTGATTWLIDAIQDAFDALALPDGLVKDYITLSGTTINGTPGSPNSPASPNSPNTNGSNNDNSPASTIAVSFVLLLVSMIVFF